MNRTTIRCGWASLHKGVFLAGAVVVFGALASHASASMIGVNFVGDLPAVDTLTSNTSAGVVSQINWNNFTGSSGTLSSLKDDTGTATTANITLTSNGTWRNNHSVTQQTGDKKMMDGMVYGTTTSDITFTVSNIPSSFLSSGYDVYVYSMADASGRQVGITLGSTTYYTAPPNGTGAGYCDGTTGAFTYTQGTSTNSGSPTLNANYVKFSNLTSSSFTVTVDGIVGSQGLEGFQIVPEPGTLALLAFGSLAVMHRRRKNSK